MEPMADAHSRASSRRSRLVAPGTIRTRERTTTFGPEATAWRAIDPWSGRGGLAVWSVAVIAAEINATTSSGERDGEVAIRIEWPA